MLANVESEKLNNLKYYKIIYCNSLVVSGFDERVFFPSEGTIQTNEAQ